MEKRVEYVRWREEVKFTPLKVLFFLNFLFSHDGFYFSWLWFNAESIYRLSFPRSPFEKFYEFLLQIFSSSLTENTRCIHAFPSNSINLVRLFEAEKFRPLSKKSGHTFLSPSFLPPSIESRNKNFIDYLIYPASGRAPAPTRETRFPFSSIQI